MRGFWIISFLLNAFAAQADEIWLGATTTLRDSGFLEYILPAFEAESGDEVVVLTQSTGQILQSARDGNVDLLLTHHQKFEEEFIAQGYGRERFELMRSQFVLVGPKADPAGVRGLDMDAAFAQIAAKRPLFVARGDESGTALREEEIWSRNGIDDLEFRMVTGQGMGASLNIASALGGYILSETASFAQFQNKGDLEILVDHGEGLENIYALTALSPERFAKRNLRGADRLIEYLGRKDTLEAIDYFEISGVKPFEALNE